MSFVIIVKFQKFIFIKRWSLLNVQKQEDRLKLIELMNIEKTKKRNTSIFQKIIISLRRYF